MRAKKMGKFPVVGLDFDGVVVDLTGLEARLGRGVTEEDTVLAPVEELCPVAGVEEVISLGIVEAVVTRRALEGPVKEWFRYWFGGVPVPVYCVGPYGDKVRKCKELGINVFVDDDYGIVKRLRESGIVALWFRVDKDRNLYMFLKKKGVLELEYL
jgi:hypothetical protein